MTLFLSYLIAHIIGDFVLQPTKWVEHKSKHKLKSKYLYLHAAVHFGLLCLILLDSSQLGYIFFITATHLVIDGLKISLGFLNAKRLLFFLDQIAHLMVLLIVANAQSQIEWHFFEEERANLLALAASILLVSYAASVVMQVIMSYFRFDELAQKDSLTNAGKYIGMLERLFVFGFVAIDYWAGIGFLLAAKSIFRFGDLSRARDRKLTEYILIGTLLSFGMAILVALGYKEISV